MALVECVPNFSEGRDSVKVDTLVAAIRSVAGVSVLDREMDADHNRCVITFVGQPEAAAEAALRGVAKAVELIDLTKHKGEHPRIGAADVVPFVPLEGVTIADCVELARRLGEQIWRKVGVPVYLYEAAATRPERRNLEHIRRGQFEGLRDEIATNEERQPDFGEPRLHATAGATVVGARKFLIAYNINLDTPDVNIAKQIARKVRASSGGLPHVKAMGVELKARKLAQVSMNLTDFEQTPVLRVYDEVEKEAAALGAKIVGSEIIGLIPKKALEQVAATALKVENWDPGLILENRMAAVLAESEQKATLRSQCEPFINAVSESTATPGGGSVAALAAALAGALGHMVAGLSRGKKAHAEHGPKLLRALDRLETLIEETKQAIDADAAAFEAVRGTYRLPKEDPARAAAVRGAIEVPLRVVERAAEIRKLLDELVPITSPAMASDLKVGRLMADAAIEGAKANVEINLREITDPGYADEIRRKLSV